MPSDVKAAIKSVITDHGNMTEQESKIFILQLEKSGKYTVEAWS